MKRSETCTSKGFSFLFVPDYPQRFCCSPKFIVSLWLFWLASICFHRRDCSAHEPSSCCHRGCSRPAEVCKTRPSPVRTCARPLLRYPEEKHTAVQQLRVSVGLRRARLFPPLLQGPPMQIRFIFVLFFMHFPTPRCPFTSVFSLSVFRFVPYPVAFVSIVDSP